MRTAIFLSSLAFSPFSFYFLPNVPFTFLSMEIATEFATKFRGNSNDQQPQMGASGLCSGENFKEHPGHFPVKWKVEAFRLTNNNKAAAAAAQTHSLPRTTSSSTNTFSDTHCSAFLVFFCFRHLCWRLFKFPHSANWIFLSL